jgi:PAS domain S-box-containing protein
LNVDEKRKELLKKLIKDLHKGANQKEMKKTFQEQFKDISSTEIAHIEEELIKEGISRDEIRQFCDIHLAMFRESLEKQEVLTSPGHPIYILMEEHKLMVQLVDELKIVGKNLKDNEESALTNTTMKQVNAIKENLQSAEKHYIREENVLFPYLEKHDITEPPAIMWMEHNKIRSLKKDLYQLTDETEQINFRTFQEQFYELTTALYDMISNHFYKENKVLFPTSLNVLNHKEWEEIRLQFDEIEYCNFTPKAVLIPFKKGVPIVSKRNPQEFITFETGILSEDEVKAIFNSLPVDVTFVDKNDTVKYFSQSKDRIFVRTKAVIGRKVQECHPQKSVHIVNQILEDFKKGKRNEAVFWITLQDRLIYIRYFPIRNIKGNYLGCLEVTQDITDIQKIKGEKRLLDS